MKKLSIFVYLLLIVVVLSAGYFLSKNSKKNNSETERVACPQDTKICDDGSFVKRIAPGCEFEMCPVVKEDIKQPESASSTKTMFDVSQKVSFEYIDNFYLGNNLTEYVMPVQWPPQIAVHSERYTCKSGSKVINGRSYCLTTQSEGAAGSIYTTYMYKTLISKKTVSLTFIVRMPQCANYEEPKKTACEDEKKTFNINQIVDKIFQSVKFVE